MTRAVVELLGEVALLLWGVHMARSGVMRGYGGRLRRLLGKALRHRLTALLAGLGVTLALQSSTATALMAVSLGAAAAIELVPGLAVMLGANVGTSLVAGALAFDAAPLFPVLLFAGFVTFRFASRTGPRNVGRALMGLGLVLLALHLLVDTFAPAAAAPQARDFVGAVAGEPLMALALATGLAWAMHSSVAAVLVIAALAQAGLVAPAAALAMVLGANLGSALNPLVNALPRRAPAALRLPLGNLVNRLAGCAFALPFLAHIEGLLAGIAPSPGGLVVGFHLAFNLALAAVFVPLLPALARSLERALPDRPRPDDPATPRYLDRGSLGTPAVALADAARETLRMADVVERMLAGSRELLGRDDPRLAARLRRLDDVLDRLHGELKRFLAELARGGLGPGERWLLQWVLTVALNLEHAGDVIDKGLVGLAAKRMRRRLRLTRRELAEAEAMHDHLRAQLRLAVTVFMTEDLGAALRLVEEKERFRELERSAARAQFARVEAGGRESETGGLHLDTVRELKRVEAHLATVAHPLLERSKLLRPSRLLPVPELAVGRQG